MAESCRGCYYWRGAKDSEFCHYMLDTGFPRNCPAENCLFYKKESFKMGKGHKIPENTRLKVLEAVNAGIKYSDIACSFKIGQTSVRRIAKAAQKESPEAPTAMENASEDKTVDNIDNTIVPDTKENVKRVPESVLTVIAREISDIEDEIETLTERIDRLRADKSEMEKWYFDNISIGRFYKGSGEV